jgi:hypothetical protein
MFRAVVRPRSPLGPILGIAFDSPKAHIPGEQRYGRSYWVCFAGDHEERDSRRPRKLVLVPVDTVAIIRYTLQLSPKIGQFLQAPALATPANHYPSTRRSLTAWSPTSPTNTFGTTLNGRVRDFLSLPTRRHGLKNRLLASVYTSIPV